MPSNSPQTELRAPYAVANDVLAVIRDQAVGKLRRDLITSDFLIERYTLRPNYASYVLTALRFLGLVDQQGRRTPAFHAFYQPHADWRGELHARMVIAYAPLLPHLKLGVPLGAQVNEAFKLYEPRGMRRQMAALFLGLANACGLSLRPEALAKDRERASPPQPSGAGTPLPPKPVVAPMVGDTAAAPPLMPQPPDDEQLARSPLLQMLVREQVQVAPPLQKPTLPVAVGSVEMWRPTLDGEAPTDEAASLAATFAAACADYGVRVEPLPPKTATLGPQVLRLYFALAKGQRLPAVRAVLPEVGLLLRRGGLLITPIPERGVIALDVPRRHHETVGWDEGLAHMPEITSPEQMPIAVGVTPEGQHLTAHLNLLPHLLVGGTTGSGKTIFLYTLIATLLARHPRAEDLRLLLSTSKPEDFSQLAGLPHLISGAVICDAGAAIGAIEGIVTEQFEQRGKLLVQAECRDIAEYNQKHDRKLPPIVVMVDEFADLADQLQGKRKEKEAFYTGIRRVAQLGRSRGVHLVLATQRPSADLLPTNIRSLLNARIALRTNDTAASTMILEEAGAECLQRGGDMLFKQDGAVQRVQGYFIEACEVANIPRG